MGERNIATHDADEFGTKFSTMVFVGAKKMSHFVKQKQLSWI